MKWSTSPTGDDQSLNPSGRNVQGADNTLLSIVSLSQQDIRLLTPSPETTIQTSGQENSKEPPLFHKIVTRHYALRK